MGCGHTLVTFFEYGSTRCTCPTLLMRTAGIFLNSGHRAYKSVIQHVGTVRRICVENLSKSRNGLGFPKNWELHQLNNRKAAWVLWHRVRRWYFLSRDGFVELVLDIRLPYQSNSQQADEAENYSSENPLAKSTAHVVTTKVEPAMWLFVTTTQGGPTNNAERGDRSCVIWRRKISGSQTQAGSSFRKSLTVVTTLKSQQRNVLEFDKQFVAGSARVRHLLFCQKFYWFTQKTCRKQLNLLFHSLIQLGIFCLFHPPKADNFKLLFIIDYNWWKPSLRLC